MKLLTGNIFDSEATIIGHGVNCRGAFGAGIAGQIRLNFPEAYDSYIIKHTKEGWQVGDIQLVPISYALDHISNHYNTIWKTPYYIANLATQDTYGRTGKHVNYNAVGVCLYKLFTFAEEKSYSVALPKIGSGLAGGDWNKVLEIIKDCYKDKTFSLEIWEYK